MVKAEPAIRTISEAVRDTGVLIGITGMIYTVATGARALSDLPLLVGRFIFSIFSLGYLRRRKAKSWGTVYDNVTKRPLDPVIVQLHNEQGNEVQMATTDLDGRFGFLAQPGTYSLTVAKSNYSFPAPRQVFPDPVYTHPYFGELITVTEASPAILYDVPMIPLAFDWNEYQKYERGFYRFFTGYDRSLAYLTAVSVPLGALFSLIIFIADPSWWNGAFIAGYGILFLAKALGYMPRPYGIVTDPAGVPLPFAYLKAFRPGTEFMVGNAITDHLGRYFMLTPPEHEVDIELSVRANNEYVVVARGRFSAKRGHVNVTIVSHGLRPPSMKAVFNPVA